MNITLSAKGELIRRAREVARRQGKSLNQLLREYMESLSTRVDGVDAAGELFGVMDEGQGDLEGRSWTRDELHDR
jgi:hypothetical protein